MFRKTMLAGVVVAIALLVPGAAVAQQSLSLNIGYFALKGEDSRVADDVMLENLNYHVFKVSDFNGATVGGEWLIPVGRIFEVGVGVGYYQRNVPTVYADYVNEDGSEIEQDFKLRVVPVTGIVRFLPTGRGSAIQPYIGAGIGVLSWRYSESGEFIDSNGDIFRERFVGKGTNAGPVVVGGIRFPLSTGFAFGGEVRYQQGEGELNTDDFNGPAIDLGGFTFQASLVFRF